MRKGQQQGLAERFRGTGGGEQGRAARGHGTLLLMALTVRRASPQQRARPGRLFGGGAHFGWIAQLRKVRHSVGVVVDSEHSDVPGQVRFNETEEDGGVEVSGGNVFID